MERCKYVLTDQIGDKYCGNDKSPYCSDWCEIHEENCKYKVEYKMKFDKKLDEEVCKDLLALKDMCAKAYNLTENEKHDLYWGWMIKLYNILVAKESQEEMKKIKKKVVIKMACKGGKKKGGKKGK